MNYNCKKCLYETNRFSDIIRHYNRKKKCNKTLETIQLKYTEDEFIRLSLIPNSIITLKKNINIINNNIISKQKMFELINLIDKKKLKKCPLCDKEYDILLDVRFHLILECITLESEIKEEKEKEKEKQNKIDENLNISNSSINNSTIINNNNNINNINNTINNINIIHTPVSFDDNWNISHLSNDEKTVLILSMVKYTKTLEYLLKNKSNHNVLIDKDSNLGLVFNNNNIEKMSIDEICDKSFNKIYDHLKNFYQDIDIINCGEIDKNYIELQKKSMKLKYLKYRDNDDNAKNIANENLLNIFDKVKEKTIENFNQIQKINNNNININGF